MSRVQSQAAEGGGSLGRARIEQAERGGTGACMAGAGGAAGVLPGRRAKEEPRVEVEENVREAGGGVQGVFFSVAAWVLCSSDVFLQF